MVYDSDFYTTRRPYRTSPNLSSYTSSYLPSRQVRVLPGLGKVHVVHTYDRIVPYVGHKRLTVVTSPPKVYSTRPSVLHREYDWIESKVRPRVGYSAVNRYLNSDSAVKMLTYLRNPISGYEYSFWPDARFFYHYKIYRPLSFHTDWPITSREWYPNYWPTFNSYGYYLNDAPSEKAFREIRVRNDLYF